MRSVKAFFLLGLMLMVLVMPGFIINSGRSKTENEFADTFNTNVYDNQSFQNLGLAGSKGLYNAYSNGSQRDLNGSTRLLVGVGNQVNDLRGLEKLVVGEDANVADTIFIGKKVEALALNVSYDRLLFLAQKLQTSGLTTYVEPDVRVNVSYSYPNDPLWSFQWGPQKIKAESAWDVTKGSSSILVAIVDTGIDYNHPDLAANYVPLGYNWVSNNTNVLDDYGHGTLCAGIVAAAANNGIGIAGIAQVHIMAEKVLDSNGLGWDSWVAEGIVNATDAGANIISLSLGSTDWSDLMFDAVNYAQSHGALVIAAAGNNGNEVKFYPAGYDGVVAVSATDSNDSLASFSNFGDWIDLAAPGVIIWSTMPTYNVTMNQEGYGQSYYYASGTSMACPCVAGVAALAWSEYRNCSADQIRWVLEQTADKVGGFTGRCDEFGYGRVNALKAVSLFDEHDLAIMDCESPHRVDPGSVFEFNVSVGNYGRENETNVEVQLFANNSLIGSATIASLEAFSSKTVFFTWDTNIIGNYNITCYVLPVLDEKNTSNNVASSQVAIRFPATLTVGSDYRTIHEALNYSGEGDTILVNQGFYDEGEIDIQTNNITLAAAGNVIIDGSQGLRGIYVKADYVTVEGFDLRNCPRFGIEVYGHFDVLTNNNLVLDGESGESLFMHDSTGCVIGKNYIEALSELGYGVLLTNCSTCTLTNNRLIAIGMNCFSGLYIDSCTNCTISFNFLMNGGWCLDGLTISDSSEDNLILSNVIEAFHSGMILSSDSNNILRNNTMINNNLNFCPWGPQIVQTGGWTSIGAGPWTGPDDVDASNTVDGKPICYWVNVSDRIVPLGTGCVVLINCKNITVENLELMKNQFGVFMMNSSGILIQENNLTDDYMIEGGHSGGINGGNDTYNINVTRNDILRNAEGIVLLGHNNTVNLNMLANNFFGIQIGDNSTVTQNQITGTQTYGVSIADGSENVTVSSNNLMANRVSIEARGSNQTITSNNILGYPDGLQLLATNCTIAFNNFVDCGRGCVIQNLADPSNYSLIYHNNFINNSIDVVNYDNSTNNWDAGLPTGGNYWSNYNGIDANGDGIGDTPYVPDANVIDNYPLMNPASENLPPRTFTLVTAMVRNVSGDTYTYTSPLPFPGTCVFIADSTIPVDVQSLFSLNAIVDRWELDGENLSSGNSVNVLMDKNHTLVLFMYEPPQFTVTINPLSSEISTEESVVFNSTLSNWNAQFEYQWYVNGSAIFNATTPSWTFTPSQVGLYNVTLVVRLPWYYQSPDISGTISNVAWVNVVVPFTSASVTSEARVLNTQSKSDWFNVSIELPLGYDVGEINVSTVTLNCSIPAQLSPTIGGDPNNNSIPDLTVRFNRTQVCQLIIQNNITFGNVTIEIKGDLYNGSLIKGFITIKVSSIIGDINCDGKVDLRDLILVVSAYGSHPQDSKWNNNACFARPYNTIGLSDLVTLAVNYGKQIPQP